jgi:hypothetical protein
MARDLFHLAVIPLQSEGSQDQQIERSLKKFHSYRACIGSMGLRLSNVDRSTQVALQILKKWIFQIAAA